jgi:hypothetical protein
MLPSFIPDGFTETLRFEGMMTIIHYENEDGEPLHFSVQRLEDFSAIGTTDRTHEELLLDGIVYHVFTLVRDFRNVLIVWEYGGNRYQVDADLPVEVLLEMARSVQ